jgi:2-oxo-4-hydroxy-4-carboxy-5-ureidoimidazoline decarboxylase
MTMEMSMPTVTELLSKPASEITSFLGGIYEHSLWVAEALVEKPDAYVLIETVTDLAALMKSIVDDASKEKKMELLCAHPDLCEKVGKMKSLTEESKEEQSRSGLQSLTEEETERFNKMNTAYRAKFNFPFILAVRNATKFTVLAALEGRLPHPVEKEFVTSLEQVHKIAWMRLLSKISTVDAEGFLTCHVLDTANGCPGTSYLACLIALIQSRLVCFSFASLIFFFFLVPADSGKDENPPSSIVSTRVCRSYWRICDERRWSSPDGTSSQGRYRVFGGNV